MPERVGHAGDATPGVFVHSLLLDRAGRNRTLHRLLQVVHDDMAGVPGRGRRQAGRVPVMMMPMPSRQNPTPIQSVAVGRTESTAHSHISATLM